MRDDDDTDDEGLDLVEREGLAPAAPATPRPRVRKPLAKEELDLLDVAVLAAIGAISKDERQFWAARVVEARPGVVNYRHDGMIRSILALAAAWRNGLDGARELAGVRNEVSGHFRKRFEKRRAGAGNAG